MNFSGVYGGILQIVFWNVSNSYWLSNIDDGTLTIVGIKRIRRRRGLDFFLHFVCFSHEFIRSGSSIVGIDWGINQSFVEFCVRQIFTFNFESIELVEDNDELFIGGVISICNGTGCFDWWIRFRIAL